MPVAQVCLGGTFSVFEIQPLLSNLGLMFVHCLKLCQLPDRPWPPPCLVLTVLHPRLVICLHTAKLRSHSPLFTPRSTRLDLLTCWGIPLPLPAQKSSSSWTVVLSPGLSAHQLPPGWVLITRGAGDVNLVPRPHLTTFPQNTPGPAFSGWVLCEAVPGSGEGRELVQEAGWGLTTKGTGSRHG